jgi:hypothetical protein
MQKLSIDNQTHMGSGVGVSVSSMGVLSYQRAFRQVIESGTSITFPLLMVIINIDGGKVKVNTVFCTTFNYYCNDVCYATLLVFLAYRVWFGTTHVIGVVKRIADKTPTIIHQTTL